MSSYSCPHCGEGDLGMLGHYSNGTFDCEEGREAQRRMNTKAIINLSEQNLIDLRQQIKKAISSLEYIQSLLNK